MFHKGDGYSSKVADTYTLSLSLSYSLVYSHLLPLHPYYDCDDQRQQ